MRRRSFVGALGCLGVLILGAIAVVVWAILAAPVNTPVLGNLRYSCTLTATHADLNVTIRGPLSGRECERLLERSNLLPVTLVRTTSTASGSVLCTFTSQYTTVTVRGSSLFKLGGDRFCSLVKQIATSTLSGNAPPSNVVPATDDVPDARSGDHAVSIS